MASPTTRPEASNRHDASDLERLFDQCFRADYATTLVGAGAEPLYIPSATAPREPHRVVYRADYFASALHEIAHWCIAGRERRALEDYGPERGEYASFEA